MFYSAMFILSIGTIFYYFDASIGTFYFDDHMGFWYKYGLYWAQNQFPPKSYYFPQLWPANWSISHVLTSDQSITLFNKIIMQLFPLGILMLYMDLAINQRRRIYLLGLLLIALIIPLFYSMLFIVDGNPELAVMFFSFLAFYFFYLNKNQLFEWKNIVLIIIFASSSALTKLSGLSIVFLLFCWLTYNFIFNKGFSYRYKLKYLLGALLLVSYNLLWYLIKPMYTGLDQSYYFKGETELGRFLSGLDLLSANFGLLFFIPIMFLYFLSYFNKDSRFISFFIVLPILGIYTARYAYSIRNASITLPLLAFVAPFGLKIILNNYASKFKINVINKNIVLLAAIGIIILFSLPATYGLIDSINYFFRAKIFNFTQEKLDVYLGYQKHYEYFINAVRTSCVLMIIVLIIKKMKINWKYFVFSLVSFIIILNFSFIDNNSIKNLQKKAVKDIAINNFNQLIPLYTNRSEISVLSNTNLNDWSGGQIFYYENLSTDKNITQDYIFWEKEINRNYNFSGYEIIYDDLSYVIFAKE
ncbi:MAG: hypothetical protein ACFFKA_17330 [Candidatus Thorarchaeota archaeon]